MHKKDDTIRELENDLKAGRHTRWEFLTKATAMGVSLAVADTMLSNPAFAENKAERELQAGKLILDYWTPFAGPDGPNMGTLVDAYNHKNPYTYFKYLRVGGGYETKMTAAAISKTLPEVAAYRLDWLPDAIARGIFQPIDDLAARMNVKASDFAPAVWQGGQQKGRRYAIPLDTHVAVFFVNQNLLSKVGIKEVPKDRASFEAAAKALTSDSNYGFQVPINWPLPMHFSTWLWQLGGELTNADHTKFIYNSPAGQQALQFMVDMVYKAKTSPKGASNPYQAFLTGKNAMIVDGIWVTNEVLQNKKLDAWAGPVPYVFGKACWSGSHQLAVPNNNSTKLTTQKRAAVGQFIEYIVNNAAIWAKGGQIPASAAARSTSLFKGLMPESRIAEEEPYVRFVGPYPGVAASFFGTITDYGSRALLGKMSVKDALDNSVRVSNQLLAQARATFGQGSGLD